MYSTNALTESDVARIKRLLWRGDSLEALTGEFGSLYTIRAILYGRRHASVPWPDGSLGPMPREHRAKLRAAWEQTNPEIEALRTRRIKAIMKRSS